MTTTRLLSYLLLFATPLLLQASPTFLATRNTVWNPALSEPLSILSELRGGASKASSRSRSRRAKVASLSSRTATGKKKVQGSKKEEKETNKKTTAKVGDFLKKYQQVLPLTRLYITMVVLTTLMGIVLGDEVTQGLLALDPMRTIYGLELWRPLTAATFLGTPSIGWLFSGYYLFQYGSSLERAYGTAQHLIFLATSIISLTSLSLLFGQPFFTQAVITSMLHVLSRATPHQKVKWLIFTVPYWSLPYGLIVSDVLQQQSAAAAVPHILGILAGHFYHFHKFVWPKVGGEDWLVAPDFLIRRLDPNAKKDIAKEAANKALKTRKRGKGRKLGKQ